MARYRRSARRYSARSSTRRSYSGRRSGRSTVRRAAYPRTQRIEIVHVMGPGGPVATLPGGAPAGTLGVTAKKPAKKGGF